MLSPGRGPVHRAVDLPAGRSWVEDGPVRRLSPWGQGSSDSGGTSTSGGGQGAPSTTNDATWVHRFFPALFWTTAGGDLAPAVSAILDVGVEGTYDWTGGALAAGVQGWLNKPGSDSGPS